MKKGDLHNLYKEFYFHELDVREKLTNRLQLTFAFHATILTIIAYMMRTLDKGTASFLVDLFYIAMAVSLGILSISVYFTIRAFWGNSYKGVASPNEIEKFRKDALSHEEQIQKRNSELGDKDRTSYCAADALSGYLYDEYAKCSSYNIEVNYKRGVWLHKAITFLLIAAVPLIIGSSVFVIGDMDGSSPRKEVLIKHSSPLIIDNGSKEIESALRDMKESCMTDNEHNQEQSNSQSTPPPPAPKPPETRDIIRSDPPPVIMDTDT